MSDPLVAVVVRVPDEYFPDDDDICLTAGNFVCSRLETHLIRHGHSIADWIRGGCEEDWGVYFESEFDAERFDYAICFFPVPGDEEQYQMVIQYRRKYPLRKRLLSKPRQLEADHHLHKTMKQFGKTFNSSRMLTQSQFEAEY
jgi:hypothetical protein